VRPFRDFEKLSALAGELVSWEIPTCFETLLLEFPSVLSEED
jgi:hypothetical protein